MPNRPGGASPLAVANETVKIQGVVSRNPDAALLWGLQLAWSKLADNTLAWGQIGRDPGIAVCMNRRQAPACLTHRGCCGWSFDLTILAVTIL
jgi:hypothetical protein